MLTLIPCPFDHSETVVANKKPCYFLKSRGSQVISKHTYTLYPPRSDYADYATVQGEDANLSENDLSGNSSGNIPSQSSHLADPLSTDPSLISERELIYTVNQTKSRRRRINSRTFSQSPQKRWKRHQHSPTGKYPRSHLATQQ